MILCSALFVGGSGCQLQLSRTLVAAATASPVLPGSFSDGLGSSSISSSPQFSWTAATGSGGAVISHYEVAIGSTPGANDILDWTNVGNVLNYQASGLGLVVGNTYYGRVRAVDVSGNRTVPVDGDGWVVLVSLTVEKVYPNNGNWNDYVKNANGGTNEYDQPDTACDGTETGLYSACIHGGEKRKVAVTGQNSCTGLTIAETLGVFDWECLVDAGTATFFTLGVKKDKGLRELVTANGFVDNSVTVSLNGSPVGESASGVWGWTNAVVPLPDNTGASTIALDGVDDGGNDDAYAEGTIFVFDGVERVTPGYNFNRYKLALVTLGNSLIRYDGLGALNTHVNGNPGGSYPIVLAAGFERFLWIEARVTADGGAGTDSGNGLFLSDSRFSRIHRSTFSGASSAGIWVGNSARSCRFSSTTVAENATMGLTLSNSAQHMVSDLIAENNGTEGLHLIGSDGSQVDGVTARDNGSDGVWVRQNNPTPLPVIRNITAYRNGGDGIQLYIMPRPGIDLTNVVAFDNAGWGMNVGVSYGSYRHLKLYNNGSGGINTGGGALVYDVTAINNGGYSVNVAHNTIVVNARVSGGEELIYSSNGTEWRRTFHGVTVTNSNMQSWVNVNDTLTQVLATNNTSGFKMPWLSGGARFAQVVASGNVGPEFLFNQPSNPNVLSGVILIDTADGANCVGGGAGTGMGAACGNEDTSSATWITGVDAAGALAGAVTSDSSNTSHSGGVSLYDSILDWFNFDSPFRGYIKLGAAAFPDASWVGRCVSGQNCGIFDLRLKATDTHLLNRSQYGNAPNDAWPVQASDPCPAGVHGNVAITDQYNVEISGGNDDGRCDVAEVCGSANTYLLNAFEIVEDLIGDDDGLCESNEACIYMPNFGAYQGEGNYSALTCDFQDGTVSGVTMYSYPVNGV